MLNLSSIGSALLLVALAASSLAFQQGPAVERNGHDIRVVVGTADTGLNPYHRHFRVATPSVTPAVLAEFGIDDDHVLHLGASFEEDRERGLYDDIRPGEEYWIAGTNIIAVASGEGVPLVADDHVHGVGVTGAIASANPEAIIYFAEGFDIDRVFAHPAVDIVSTSFGADLGLPVDIPTGVPMNAIQGSFDGVLHGGKLFFAATPNDPTLAPGDSAGGAWWAIAVSGWQEGEGDGKSFFASSAPDVVADWLQRLPYCDTCTDEYREFTGGTSFAAPRAAGIAADVLLRARRHAGHRGGISERGLLVDGQDVQISNWDLRRALEEGAAVVSSPPPSEDTVHHLTTDGTVPVVEAGVYTTIGWGLLTDDPTYGVVPETLAHLGLGTATRTKSLDTCRWMLAMFDARVTAYGANPTSPAFRWSGPVPYRRCA